MHRLPLTLACGLLVAIFFVAIQSPQQQQTNADDPRSSIESLLERLAKNDEAMMTLISQHGEELASVEDCHKTDSESIRTQLVALQTKVEATAEKPPEPAKVADSQCECDCKEEIAALKKRVEALEALCQSKPTVSANYIPQYGPAPTTNSGGGSTGNTVAGLGSTGSRVATPVQQSYGSTGSAVTSVTSSTVSYGSTGSSVAQRQTRTPLRTAATVVTSPFARAGHWSYPGEISNHLATDHAVQTAGMSREQMLNLHDSLHEGTASALQVAAPMVNVQTFAPARPPILQRSAPVQVPVQVQTSNCPGGVCPTGPQVSRPQTGWYLGKNLGR